MNYLFVILMMLFSFNTIDQNKETETTKKEITEIVLESNDQMKFNLSKIKVEAGSTVQLTLKHTGKLPKQAMGHNFVLLKKGVEMKNFAMTAMKARDNDYIPESTDQILAYTELIGGGESVTIEFEAPEKGEYDFICSFPSHFSLMNGKFIVQ